MTPSHVCCCCRCWVVQSCPTLCDPVDGSPSGSPAPGILQAGTLEWVAISFSNAWKWKVKVKSLSRVRLFATPWIAAYQTPPSMGFSRQEHWRGVPLPSPLHICKRPQKEWADIQTAASIFTLLSQGPLWVGKKGQHSGSLHPTLSRVRDQVNIDFNVVLQKKTGTERWLLLWRGSCLVFKEKCRLKVSQHTKYPRKHVHES